MDTIVLNLDQLIVESFTTASYDAQVGIVETGCVPDCR